MYNQYVKEMSLFAIADLHLSTDPTITNKEMDKFGGVWVEHTKRLVEIWPRLVEDTDTVLIPGDISWALKLTEVAADFDFLKTLPGKKIIMKGNHDLWWSSKKKLNTLFPDYFFLQNNVYEGDSFVIAGSRGWILPNDSSFTEETDRKIYERELLRIKSSLDMAKSVLGNRTLIAATHFPPVQENGEPTDITKLFTEYGVSKAVYGHLHGASIVQRKFNGIINGTEYKLVSLDAIGAAPYKIID